MTQKFTQLHLCWQTILRNSFFLVLMFAFTGSLMAQDTRLVSKKTEAQKIQEKRNYERNIAPALKTNNDAGLPSSSQPQPNSPTAVCATFTGSLAAGDATMPQRLNRSGLTTGSCTSPHTFPGGFGTGPYFYDTHTYTNTTGLTQCGTFTLTSTDVTNANIAMGIWSNSFNPNALATNYLADYGLSSGTPATPVVINVMIPSGATIVIPVWSANVNTTAGGTASNYTVTVDFPICSSSPCTGTPAPGNTIASASSACPGISVNLSLQNQTTGSGVTYQWQSSSTLAGPYTAIAGATNSTYSTTITANTYYRAVVTCSGNAGTSTPVLVSLRPTSQCYCAAGSPDASFEKIGNVTFAGINRTTTSTAGYENWITDTATVIAGATNQMSVTITTPFGSDRIKVWADLNQNGSFEDAGELIGFTTSGAATNVINVTVPVTANLGYTRLRIRMWDSAAEANPNSCGNTSYGQVEDYTLNILPCVQGVFTAQPTNKTTQCSGNTSFTVGATGSQLVYQWEYRTDSTAAWQTVTNGGIYSGANTNTLTLTNVTVANSGYQYRAIISGACTALDFSNVVTLTVNKLVAAVTPASATICAGTVQSLTITNTAPPVTSTFNSGPISVAIPEGTFPAGPYVAGVSNITVSGIPTTAVIANLSVRMNISHAYVGDVVAVLKAPNGQIFNLDALLDKTNGAGANFVNTVISSTGTTLLSAGTEPFTGTFKADAVGATFVAFGFTLPGGPIGYIPTTQAWSGLYSVPNGTWTLAMYDAGAPDVGTLTSWSLNVSYGAPSTGIWTGPAGTIFTNSTATTPYDGTTPVNQVFVKPTVTSNYKVVVTTSNCVSDTTTIPITVNTPITAVTSPKTVAGCNNGSTTLMVSNTGGIGTAYQWFVSSTGAAGPYTAVANGANYSGATTNTLTFLKLPSSYTNNRYYARLSNACGTVNSDTAVLTVNPNPTIVVSASPSANLQPGQTTTLTAAASPAGNYTYTWYRNGVIVPGVTGNMLTVNVDQLGQYTVRANNTGTGCTSLSGSTTVGDSTSTRLFIYPSTNNGIFQVRFYSLPGNTFARMLNVYDTKGARVYSRRYNINAPYGRMDVDLSNLSAGVYYVELGDYNGSRLATGNVLIIK